VRHGRGIAVAASAAAGLLVCGLAWPLRAQFPAPPNAGIGGGPGRARAPRRVSPPTPHWPDGRVNLGPLAGEKGVWSGMAGTTIATNARGLDNPGQNLPTNLKVTDVPFQDWARALYNLRQERPSYFGHSVGHWDGETLVVDTVGFNERFWLTREGIPHTEYLHLTERFTRVDFDDLKYEATIDDRGAYTKPWSGGWMIRWSPGEEMYEYMCQENNRDVRHMYGGER